MPIYIVLNFLLSCYRSLKKQQVLQLYQYYKYDFLAFDYYYEDYMRAAETEDLVTTPKVGDSGNLCASIFMFQGWFPTG